MNKVELNDDYINKIITGDSDIFKLKYQEDLGDGIWSVVIKDQSGEYFEGKVIQKPDNTYVLEGDAEFDRVYPMIDQKTGKIVKIKRSETYPPNPGN